MKILQCHIENFGKWSDKTFDFSTGINSFCEENGWGKSTLAAFIRIMFYGFANERKRDELENERKKYMPWQGGVYGGQITFETNGKEYVVSRIFGKKEKEDVFELRYSETNKKSSDFSTNLGEELFHIDQASFVRTVFISQNDCETQMTDGMNAKMGNLEFQKDDMSNYEPANERILDTMNKMSPTRKTGSLYKMSEMIGTLSMRVRQKNLIEQSIDKLFGYREEEKEKLRQLEQEKIECLNQQKEKTAQNEVVIKKREYDAYCRNYKQRMEQYQSVRNYFPASLPRNSELEGYVRSGSRLLEEKRSLQIYQLTAKEQELLQKFEKRNWDEDSEYVDKLDKFDTSGKLEKGTLGLISGIVLCVFGFIGYVMKLDFGVLLLMLGVLMSGISFVYRMRSVSKQLADDEQGIGKNQNSNEMQEEIRRMELERYQQLQEKERLYENSRQKCAAISKEISSYIKGLGFVPVENLQEQMLEIKEHFLECKNAYQEYKVAKEQKEDFEESCDQMEMILQMEELQEGEEMSYDEKLQQLLDEIDLCKTEISKIEGQLEQLLEQKDSILESEQELEKQQELYREGMKKYEDLKKVQEYLQSAKESFHAKYSGPIKAGFDKYYQMMTGQESLEYKIDVNSNLTASVYGMQRDSRLLSLGYQDLTGICMRMAFVDAMYQNEKPFLIWDDPFVNLDEEKTRRGLEFVEKIGQKYQIIYFTCHKSRDF